MGIGTTGEALVNPWVAEKRGWPGAMGSSLRRASSGEGVDKMGSALQCEMGQRVTLPCIISWDALAHLCLSCAPLALLPEGQGAERSTGTPKDHRFEFPWLSLLPIADLPGSAAGAHAVQCHHSGMYLPGDVTAWSCEIRGGRNGGERSKDPCKG